MGKSMKVKSMVMMMNRAIYFLVDITFATGVLAVKILVMIYVCFQMVDKDIGLGLSDDWMTYFFKDKFSNPQLYWHNLYS